MSFDLFIVSISGNALDVIRKVEKFSKLFMKKLPCTYAIFRNGELIYVGSSENCVERLKRHFIYKNPSGSVFVKHWLEFYGSLEGIEKCDVQVFIHLDVFEARRFEKELIKKFKPLFNVRYK